MRSQESHGDASVPSALNDRGYIGSVLFIEIHVQSNLSYVTLQGRKEIRSHKTGGR